jgi:RNA polymerase sigma-70 factor (ECF subfamily)
MSAERELEEYLFNQIKNGEEDAFEILFKLYYTELCNYAVTLVKEPDAAEEIVQESFIRIWEKRKIINIEVSLKAYLYKTVHNHSINFLKKDQILKRQNQDDAEEFFSYQQIINQNFDPNFLDRLFSEELGEIIEQTLKKFPEQSRAVFLLSREEKLSYQEIAERLNISINSVKTQMKRALKKLRDAVNRYS